LGAQLLVLQNNYTGLLISWIVSLVVIALIMIGIVYYIWRAGQQQSESGEAIPLRPARGYSYT